MRKNLNIYLHVFIWLAYTILLVLVTDRTFTLQDTLLKVSIVISIHISLFYANSQVLIPKLLSDKKTWLYILYIILIFTVLFTFFNWFERQFIPEDAPEAFKNRLERQNSRRPRVPPHISQMFRIRLAFDLISMLVILVISSAYSISKISRKKEQDQKLEISERIESEMKFLKSQINPHFLFNALNNIYSLTLTGAEHASDMVLKLSNMLRYVLYECNESHVAIENEWNYIDNYVDFQRLKSEDKPNIQMEFINENAGALITPMVLIPYVENAFKHSNIEDKEHGWISLSLNNNSEEIILLIENSIPKIKRSKDSIGGIGLENVKRRLELAYGKDYDLIINKTPSKYSVMLRIKKNKS